MEVLQVHPMTFEKEGEREILRIRFVIHDRSSPVPLHFQGIFTIITIDYNCSNTKPRDFRCSSTQVRDFKMFNHNRERPIRVYTYKSFSTPDIQSNLKKTNCTIESDHSQKKTKMTRLLGPSEFGCHSLSVVESELSRIWSH
ncbi:hypothetical protein MTR_3g466630 [Medicago truncatula]|uniref:Uncharacterized protein n=1 Tax=Medicago truncatula TaxID=3880 RepID=A0A072UY15_MEDTR|nr:hypothetical protein MTR_3g466630 [Medicago truncatula]